MSTVLQIKFSAEVLKEFQHPEDPRVILAPNLDVFNAAAATYEYRAVLLAADPSAEAVGLPRSPVLLPQLDVLDLRNGEWIHKEPRMNTPFLANILSKMANIYSTATWNNRVDDAVLGKSLSYSKHNHAFPVLNFSVGGEKGTGWENQRGDSLYAGEGELFLFKSQFSHFSPATKSRESHFMCAVFHNHNELSPAC